MNSINNYFCLKKLWWFNINNMNKINILFNIIYKNKEEKNNNKK